MPGKGPGHLLRVTLPDGIGNGDPFLFTQIMVELANAVQMAVDGLGRQPLPHAIINIT
jgi:hypothetical protein